MTRAEQLMQEWLGRLRIDQPGQPEAVYRSLVGWLLGVPPDRFEDLAPEQLALARQGMEYRYRLFLERYWQVSPEQGYQRLVKRLSGVFLIRQKINTWVALSRDRSRTVVEVVQEVVQEMIHSDRYLAQELTCIEDCTANPRLRNLLLLASLEEYCLRSVRNQPLVLYRCINHLQRSQRGGMTQVPTQELVQLLSEEVTSANGEEPLSRLDGDAWHRYQQEQNELDQRSQRAQVKTALIAHLQRHLGEGAVRWLELHLSGLTPEDIAQRLDLPVKKIYRLREQVTYHALRIFALKEQPTLVLDWLKTSLQDHSFGLTPGQWQQFWQGLSAEQQQILEAGRLGQSLEAIAQGLALKPKRVRAQWVDLYLKAQDLRYSAPQARSSGVGVDDSSVG
jgi:DNA-binding CsgD family transcriptional regulator